MDCSPEYIKMCNCEEIQKNHQFKKYDLFVREEEYYRTEPFVFPYDNELLTYKSIWLPRQDQLQEMLLEQRYGKDRPLNNVIALLDDFQDWILNKCDGLDWSYKHIKLSLEQLWLAFVMKERFGKVWSGTDWIKEGNYPLTYSRRLKW